MSPVHKDETVSSETTRLINTGPSAESVVRRSLSNGTLPLASSYEDLRESVELQLQSLSSGTKTKSSNKKILSGFQAILLLISGCVLCVVLLCTFQFKVTPQPAHSEPGKDPMPFSRFDPVYDLGILPFDRPESSAPPQDLFYRRVQEAKNDGRGRSTFPTNTWYQNLLLLREEPSNLHRAYPVPYMIDMVGLVPGIQVHNNRILAGTDVLQLAFNEQFGLTIGAAPDLEGATLAKHLPHRYKVLDTTDLGVTLQWVSNIFQSIVPICYVSLDVITRNT